MRVSLYDVAVSEKSLHREDEVAVIECNIDDMPGEAFSYISPRIIKMGALDSALIPITMKKCRPAVLLQVICRPEDIAKFADFLLKETATLGVRYRIEKRFKLNREIRKVETPWGSVSAKFAFDIKGKTIRIKPESASVAKLAEKENIPYIEMYKKVEKLLQD